MAMIKELKAGELTVRIYSDRIAMGDAAAADAAARIHAILAKKPYVNIVFAAAPSQSDLLQSLLQEDIDWSRVNALHMDEYVGIADDAPQRFGNFLNRAIFNQVKMHEVHYLYHEGMTAKEAVSAYEHLLAQYPPDLVFYGVGENGHLAFNDPHVADFADPEKIKIVDLDSICRQQQVNDGCFDRFDDVPPQAITLTMSALLDIPEAIAIVPGPRKADAIYRAVNEPVSTDCPATALRNIPRAVLYTDAEGASRLI